MKPPPRYCYYIPATQDPTPHGGYVPSLVTENDPGHSPMLGRGTGSAPWVWGQTLAEAEATCAAYNREQLKLTEAEVDQIVASSMRASNRRHDHHD